MQDSNPCKFSAKCLTSIVIISHLATGEMVEWSITAVLKTAVPRGTGGSNPSLSAWSTLKLNSEEIKKNVSIVTSIGYDTFLLYIIVLPEYVESTQILPKDSPMATIWLHFFLQNKNCSQEIVESSFRVRVDYCYSKYYVELCSKTTEWFIAISGYNFGV